MSRSDEVRARYEAELAVAELEDQLVALKGDVERCGECGRRTSSDSPELRAAKLQLRDARQAFRQARENGAVVNPATVEVTSEVLSPGGEQ
jgi:hypothetical protein